MWEYFPQLRPATLDDLRRLYQRWERGCEDPGEIWLNWLCRERASKLPVGAMQATVKIERQLAYIAYAYYPAHRRKGYAREGCIAVIDYLREYYGVARILADMDARNEPSYRLAESLGFVRIETRAEEFVYELVVPQKTS